ncbi:M20 family metallopeptidase [Leifsonia shinshuensis]|uniref:Glutamate carboxypeptidase n=1 Tax=Leifsonia shinshuensis TaxID=150026 RepID=A0A853D3C7_9MICO|nr:glutamate carboxypeptidase [Leifsonia shinshuensis]
MTDLAASAADALESQLADLCTFIRIETPSDHRPSLVEGLEWVEAFLERTIGPPDVRRVVGGGDQGDILTCEYRSGDPGAATVALLCHYDTVWPRGTLADWPVAIQAGRLTGPGAFDMKAGLIQAVWAVALARQAGSPLPTIRMVFNGDEEIGSPSSRTVIEDAVHDCDAVLVFEPSAAGALKTSRKGNGIFTVTAHGLEAHAGLDPRKGVSAVDELARAVLTLHAAADLDSGTSVNVGVVSGGTRSNVIAGEAHAVVDVRVADRAEAQRIEGVLAGLSPHRLGARLGVTGSWVRPVMDRSAGNAALFQRARDLARRRGLSVDETSAGGASDGNFAAALGLPVLDGLGAVGDGAHARGEWVEVSEVTSRTVLAAEVIASFGRRV